MTSMLTRKAAVLALGVAAAATTVAAVAPSASAATAPGLTVSYPASGTTVVTKPNSTVKLGPTTLTATLATDGSFTGSLPLPTTTSNFKVLGLIPVSADVSFIATKPLTGKLTGTVVSAVATYTLKLSNVKLAGIPAFAGDKCETVAPVSIPVATPKGQAFNVTGGGTVAGSYTIGDFANCGITTGLINLLVPGPNNPVTFTLGKGTVAS